MSDILPDRLELGEMGHDVTDEDYDRLEFLVSLEESRSQQRLLHQGACIDCVQQLEESGRFELCVSESSSVNPCAMEYDIMGTSQILEDEWRDAYSERLQRARQLLHAAQADHVDACATGVLIQPVIHTVEGDQQSEEVDRSSVPTHPILVSQGFTSVGLHTLVAADKIADQFTLNMEQRRAYTLITRQAMQDRPSPLRMCITGVGGTGKS